MNSAMTSLERVLTALSHKEPDRVPLFLLLSLYGAKESNNSIKSYFSDPKLVARTQIQMKDKYQNDCFYAFYYAAIELEAFGGEAIFTDDGPPNAGAPVVKSADGIKQLVPPKINDCCCLLNVLETINILKTENAGDTPIIGVVMSPFSLPVMQMGFDKYLDLIVEQPALFDQLMRVNEEFCVAWANAQLDAGATAICYFDPVSSPTIVPRDMYLKTSHEITKRTLSRIKGPTATHLASGRTIPVIDDIALTGTAILGVSSEDDLSLVKDKCRNKLTILGNLNGIEMCRWSPSEAESAVKQIISQAASGGGLIISDNHGEIPYQVPEETLLAIAKAVRTWGKYPLDWVRK